MKKTVIAYFYPKKESIIGKWWVTFANMEFETD